MKLSLNYLVAASTISLAAASSCTSDVAIAWPYTPDGSGTTDCNGDAACLALEAEGQCNALALVDEEDTTCVEKLKKWKSKRAIDLECTGSETCFLYTDNSLLCMDTSSGDYHDDIGGSGNAISGVYTAPNGDVQTITGVSAEPTATATGSGSGSAASVSATSTEQSASQTETGTATSGSGSTAASASQSSAAAEQTNGVVSDIRVGSAVLAAIAMPLLAVAL